MRACLFHILRPSVRSKRKKTNHISSHSFARKANIASRKGNDVVLLISSGVLPVTSLINDSMHYRFNSWEYQISRMCLKGENQ